VSDHRETAYERHLREFDRRNRFEVTVSVLVVVLVGLLAWLVNS